LLRKLLKRKATERLRSAADIKVSYAVVIESLQLIAASRLTASSETSIGLML
jgi:hypothetical protein